MKRGQVRLGCLDTRNGGRKTTSICNIFNTTKPMYKLKKMRSNINSKKWKDILIQNHLRMSHIKWHLLHIKRSKN